MKVKVGWGKDYVEDRGESWGKGWREGEGESQGEGGK